MLRRYLALALVTGCFRPAPAPGAPCSGLLECPQGLVCDTAADPPLCVETLSDAAPPDGADGPPLPAPITWREVVSGSLHNTILSEVTTDGPIAVAPGDLFLAFVSVKPPHGITSISGLDLTWTRLRQQCAGRNTARTALFWATGPMPRAGAVTVTLNGGTAFLGSAVLSVHRYSGAHPVMPVGNLTFANTNGADGDALCSGGSDTLTYDFTLATTVPGAVVVSGVHTSNSTHDPGAGFTERSDVQSADDSVTAGIAVEDQTIAAPTPNVPVSGSFVGGAPDWAAIAIELRP